MTYIQPNPNGSATSANSAPVVIASDQATVPVSLASVPSHAVTNAGTFAVQAAEADGANVTLGAKADAKNAATDTTAVSAMSVLKQISASVQAPPSQAVTNTGTFAVQATGTVTANAGTNLNTSALALDATLTGGTQQSKITDGTTVATVKAASTAAGATDKALVVAISPNNTVPVSLATNTPTLQSGSTTAVTQATGTNLHTVVDSGTITAVTAITNALPVGANVIGKVSIDQTTPGTTNLVALAANQSVNISQMNGVATTMGNGVSGTGVQRVTLASDSTGQVALAAGSATIGALTANQSVNNAQIAGVATATGNGVVGTGVQRVAIASDNTAFSVNATLAAGTALAGKFGIDQTTAGTTNAVSLAQLGVNTIATGNGTSSTGTLRVSVASDSTGQIALAAGSALAGKFGIDQTTIGTTNGVTQVPAATGGLTTYHLVSAGSTNATNIKASAGQVYGWYIYNSNAAARKVAFHNTAGTPTAGASVFFSLVIPPTAGANVHLSNGIAFSTGIGITTVTDLTDAGTTAVAASDLIINVFYK